MENYQKNQICCDGCGCTWGKHKKMYETAWSGVHWCGDPKCAKRIMKRECERIKKGDCKF